MSSNKSQSKQQVVPSPSLTRLQGINLDLAEQQLRVLTNQEAFQNQLYASGSDLIDDFSQLSSESDRYRREDMSALETLERSGFEATPEQKRLIAESIDASLKAGQSDINQGLEESLGLIRSELAPGLGLRPGDSPLIDRGGLLAREALRQRGLLSLGLRGQQAKAELDYPLIASEAKTGIKQFQASLQDSAFRNRLALTGGIGGLGLALGTAAPSSAATQTQIAANTRNGGYASSGTTTPDYINAVGNLYGGLGSFLGGS